MILLREDLDSKGKDSPLASAERSLGSLLLVLGDVGSAFESKSNRTGFFAVLIGWSWLSVSSMRGLCSR
jgi:hypothetical protein